MLIWFGIAFLWGGAMSCISMAAGMLIKKYVISSIVPFLVFTAEQILALYVMQRYTITIKGTSIGLVWTDMLYAGSYDDIVSGTYSAMYRSDYHDIHAYLHFTRKKI